MAPTPNPANDERRAQHPVEVTKVWPNAVTPSTTPLPGATTKKSPTDK